MTPNQIRWQKYAEKAKQRRKAVRLRNGPIPKISEDKALWAADELKRGTMLKCVAIDLGVHYSTVQATLKRMGLR